jgi:hypothetical protein
VSNLLHVDSLRQAHAIPYIPEGTQKKMHIQFPSSFVWAISKESSQPMALPSKAFRNSVVVVSFDLFFFAHDQVGTDNTIAINPLSRKLILSLRMY